LGLEIASKEVQFSCPPHDDFSSSSPEGIFFILQTAVLLFLRAAMHVGLYAAHAPMFFRAK
jgi:hypothetical protein